MNKQIETFLGDLQATGLVANATKCKSLTFTADGKRKRTCVDRATNFWIDGQIINAMGHNETYRYLGIQISSGGALSSIGSVLGKGHEEISRAPLKPQQKLYLLRT